MSTTQETDTSNKYDPSSMGTFQGLQGPLGGGLKDWMQNPYGNPQFGLEQQMGTRQAQNLGGTQMSNITRNIQGSGAGGNMSPFALEMMQNQGRANSGMQAQMGFINPMQQALQRQQFAMGTAANYRPLQTGGTQTQSTGGLGTWLPQVAGMAMGGLTGLAGMGGGGFFSGAGAHPGGFSQPFGGGGGFGGGMGMGPDLGMPSFMNNMPSGGSWFGPMGSGSGASGMGGYPWM